MTILEYIKKHNYHTRVLFFMVGLFVAAMSYNLFIEPNNLLVGGLSGLAVIEKNTIGINTTLFIDICEIVLVILGIIFIGVKETFSKLLGCIIFPIMLTFTSTFTGQIYLDISSTAFKVTLAALTYGFSLGLIGRCGFGAFGMDIAVGIIAHKRTAPSNRVATIINSAIVVLGILVLSPVNILYSVYLIVLLNLVAKYVMFGTSSTKLIYIISNKYEKIEKELKKLSRVNYLDVDVKDGTMLNKKRMVICVVHNTSYTWVKRKVLKIDKNAFIITSKCYELGNIHEYTPLPF